MLQRKNRRITFVWTGTKNKPSQTPLSKEWECSFTTPLSKERELRFKNTDKYGEYVNKHTIFVNPGAKTESKFDGLACVRFGDYGQIDKQTTYEFFRFEHEIYVLEDMSYLPGFILMKMKSDNVKQDWQWLCDTLRTETYLITYTGPDLDEESSILAICSTLSECYDWMRKLARKNGVSEKLLKMDSIVYEEIMLDTYGVGYSELSEVRNDPYGHLRRCDEDSMWALVNNDFSRITAKRWKQLEKRIKFPKVKYTPQEEDELVENHTQTEKESWRYA